MEEHKLGEINYPLNRFQYFKGLVFIVMRGGGYPVHPKIIIINDYKFEESKKFKNQKERVRHLID